MCMMCLTVAEFNGPIRMSGLLRNVRMTCIATMQDQAGHRTPTYIPGGFWGRKLIGTPFTYTASNSAFV